MFRSSHRICNKCSHKVLSSFTNDLTCPSSFPRTRGKFILRSNVKRTSAPITRAFTTQNALKAYVEDGQPQHYDQPRNSAQMEAIVQQARQIFGETLPENFLSKEEYQIYERLYGPPSATTLPEDVDLLMGIQSDGANTLEGDDQAAAIRSNVLFREDKNGNLEEVVFEDNYEENVQLVEELDEVEESEDLAEAEEEAVQEFTVEDLTEESQDLKAQEGLEEVNGKALGDEAIQEEFQIRMDILKEQNAARKKAGAPQKLDVRQDTEDEMDESPEVVFEEENEVDESIEDGVEEYDTGVSVRAHPLTKAGRFSTSPSTIQLPKASLVDPTTALFAETSNRQLREVAQRTFGGKGLPSSTATIRRPNLRQETIPLEASHGRMGEMEANAFLAAIYPGAFASTMSALVEVRKRLGSDWLRGLMAQPDGPRILDAGSGGAAVLASREVIQAEYESMNPDLPPEAERLPFGKSTVLTGSHTLRHRASTLLDDTTFIPRLPDYDPSRDHPSLESSNPQPRKQYDIIIAPYTLWPLREDYHRKAHLQNLWSLLDSRSGVLILIEKGVPRGFELIAAARETLLQHHISSPGDSSPSVDPAHPNRFTHKEEGMIIAPCTNHGKCPMYITAGAAQGRKDFCRFTQRFIRPPYLQRILGEKNENHEDISFSYVALQRGTDLRKEESFVQGAPATDAAFEGYEDFDAKSEGDGNGNDSINKTPPHPLSLPRAIMPPIKRHGHVTLDLCTPAATIERWTVPKSFSKQAYRDARKSKWGDLWALGAKTRVARNIRVGVKRREEKILKQEVEDVDEGESDGVGGAERMGRRGVMMRNESGVKGKAEARDRKGQMGKKKREKYRRKDKEGMTIE